MKLRYPVFLASAMLALAGADANAATLLTQTVAPNRHDHTGMIGMVFTVGASSLSVTSLGFQDAGGDGLVQSHQVGIWDSAGNLVTSATIAIGGGTLVDNFRYVPVTAVTLTAGAQYTIGATVANAGVEDVWTDAGFGPGFTISADVTPNGDVYNSAGFSRPTLNGNGHDLRWSPGNMQYTVVPEPSAALLGGLGLLALVRRRRRELFPG